MLDQVLDLFEITPDYDLDIMKPGQDLYDVTSNVLLGMKSVLSDYKPDVVFVHGDTSTTFATALAAFYQQIRVAHVEAGLRTGDIYSPWPEEANRQLTTQITAYHFAPTETSKENLLKENVSEKSIEVTGNTVIDALFLTLLKIENSRDLKNKTIAVVGYGSQGHAQAQNMRASGLNVIVSELPGTSNFEAAVKDGFEPVSAEEAAKKADVIQLLVPDQAQAKVYATAVAAHMTAGKALVFSHGFNIHYGQIVPPADVDVYMVAPKSPGHLVRDVFVEGGGVPCLIAVYQDASGKAKETALAHAKGIGGTRAGVLETTFKEETETDLFGEQAVLCGGVEELVKAGFETLVTAGYKPEIAYFECLHELKLLIDLFYRGGISFMNYSVSDTAEYGGYTRGPRVINEESRWAMQEILKEVQNGTFAREWLLECQVNRPMLMAERKKNEEHLIEKVGKKLRGMMSWINK